ncbi:peptide-methionine (S)-S-oxide reductase [Mariniflexile fucanivorans]|uniref:peptide-methionine (S)-S-oxide reductase n=1 Tax=Mariniflexile fucanivorans TaxID=264023 RepID=A0A4R1RH33_9FLAO|nr:peptide-methionine (S)-S-oxide reductase [Mariniflexile fucanivorans]TCL65368.1 peptide-methionine (S)-S-oxide reductase [Mariniflexile fucanivorans]
MELISKIALGGGCHWCTEAVFQSLIGVENVEQGYVSSVDGNNAFSEAVIVHFNSELISLETLIEIHLYTHKSTSNHSMRTKYRSAIYTFSEDHNSQSEAIIKSFQKEFDNKLITKVYPFHSFKASREAVQNYYQKNPEKPFCETFINPKLKLLLEQFSHHTNIEKLSHLTE